MPYSYPGQTVKQTLKIFIERLRDGKTQSIAEDLNPSFMDVKEQDLLFEQPIHVHGEAYLAEDWLIVKLTIETQAKLYCAVCNEPFNFAIKIQEMMHEEPLENSRDAAFDLIPLVRETILLEIPFLPQCGTLKCNNRQEVEKYLKKEKHSPDADMPVNGHKPFQDLM